MTNLFRVRSPRLQALAMAAIAVFMANEGQAQRPQADAAAWRERCKQWIERKGYPVDYIELKTGKRQGGMAANWKGNLKPEEVQAGDVVISSRTVDGRSIQVAGYVEAVEPASGGTEIFVTVSAMGVGGKMLVDRECFVSETFGQVSRWREPISTVLRVWRPSLPLE